MFKVPEKYRFTNRASPLATNPDSGNNGCFIIPFESFELVVIASDGEGWEHVSVSMRNRTPNWREMCFVKDLFWGAEDWVVQYHPPISEYVNNHPNCLHLWRPTKSKMPTPPSILVGLK